MKKLTFISVLAQLVIISACSDSEESAGPGEEQSSGVIVSSVVQSSSNVELSSTNEASSESQNSSGESLSEAMQSSAQELSSVVELSYCEKNPDNCITDSRDNQAYRITTIGNQTWMAENLKFKTNESLCVEAKEENCEKYGRLYDWFDVMNREAPTQEPTGGGELIKDDCPEGWHVPSLEEWNTLLSFVNGEKGETLGGKSLKSVDGWVEYNGKLVVGSDDYAFNGLPIGFIDPEGDAVEFEAKAGDSKAFGMFAIWHSSVYPLSNDVAVMMLMSDNDGASVTEAYESLLLPVRCIQDGEK